MRLTIAKRVELAADRSQELTAKATLTAKEPALQADSERGLIMLLPASGLVSGSEVS
jgi:hypothetical protein